MIPTLTHRFQLPRPSSSLKPLEAAIASALLEGELKPGDGVASPDEMARRLQIPLSEALESITHMLSRRILRQDNQGNLFIHSHAVPTVEMRQQAFLLKARQLIDVARKWDLPHAAIEPLLFRATQHVA